MSNYAFIYSNPETSGGFYGAVRGCVILENTLRLKLTV